MTETAPETAREAALQSASEEGLDWVNQDASLGASADLDYAISLLRAAQSGALTVPLVRVYRPRPTVAFGQRDVRLDGFEQAWRACLGHGFDPVVRRAGGRAAAYHEGSLVVDHLEPDADAMQGFRDRFAGFGELFAQVFREAGVPAAVGEIHGEYCAGEFSVHTPLPPQADGAPRGPVKLVGTAQRVVKGAWLFSSSIVVEQPEPIRAVLVDVYRALGLDWDPATAGAATDAVPGITVDSYADRLRAGYAAAHGSLRDRSWADLTGAIPPG